MGSTDVLHHQAQDRGLCIPMPPHPIAAEQARRLAEMILGEWGLAVLRENTLLVVSELVTNALKHHDVFWFTLECRDDTALIEVTDTSLGCPTVKRATETDTSGRGLFIVEAVSDEWGVRYENDGRKTVWATISK